MPVDFEVVHVNSALETEDDINNAITAIRRNGVALKGKQTPLASMSQVGLHHILSLQYQLVQ